MRFPAGLGPAQHPEEPLPGRGRVSFSLRPEGHSLQKVVFIISAGSMGKTSFGESLGSDIECGLASNALC